MGMGRDMGTRADTRAGTGAGRDTGMPARVLVERPRPGGCGDYATNVALQIARAAGRPPLQVAEILSPRLALEPGIAAIDITGPGFINITLAEGEGEGDVDGEGGDSTGAALVRDVRELGACYGHIHPDTGARHQLHIPREIRAAVLADTLRRILRSQGALVRLTCDDAPDPGWAGLGVQVDAHGKPPVPLKTLRPVPAPQDPAPLGRDAARWALLYPAGHDRPRIDGDEHLVQRESNPLFRVRYAYSRTRALSRNAEALGFDAAPGDVAADALLDAIADYPAVLASAARRHAPDRLARHLVDTGTTATSTEAGRAATDAEEAPAIAEATTGTEAAAGSPPAETTETTES